MADAPKRILIIKPSALGDIAIASTVLATLRNSFPDAHISWLVRREFAPLLSHCTGLDETVIFERKLLARWWCRRDAFSELKKLIAKLRTSRFDLVLDLQGLFRTGFFAWAAGSKNRIGPADARELSAIFYTRRVGSPQSCHLIDYYNALAASAGADKLSTTSPLAPSAQALERIDILLKQHNIGPGNFIVFAPAASRPYKCWPLQNFALLAHRLAPVCDMPILAIGSNAERDDIRRLVSISDGRIIDFAGKTDISTLIALLARTRLLVGNDSGPGQIAAALHRPLVMIFGFTNPARVGPYQRPDCVAAIEPFGRGTAIENHSRRFSITAVPVELVLEKTSAHLHKL